MVNIFDLVLRAAVEYAITAAILPNKQKFSQQVGSKTPHRPLPVLGANQNGQVSLGLIAAINKQCAKAPYRLDPLWGLKDYYTHPETVQYEIDYNTRKQPYDCDDLAVYAHALAEAAGVSRDNCRIWNLIINPPQQVSQMWANHVIAAFRHDNGQGTWWGVIDTNTAYHGQIFWHLGTEEEAKARFVQQFSGIYNVNYFKIIPVQYPF